MRVFQGSSLPVLSRRELLKMTVAGATVSAFGGGALAKTQVNWLGWQGYDSPLKTEDFLAKNDIELAATYLANNDEIVTKLAAQAPIDIVTPYMGYVPGLREAGLIQPIDASKVPNLPKVLPVFRDDSNLFVDGVHWSVPFTWGGGPMVYDPSAVQPTSWFDLEKPEYKGKIAMFDDAVGMMLTASIMVSGAEVASLVTPAQLEEIKKYCIKLKKEHARALFPSYGEGADAMVRGEVVMTLGGAEWLPAIVAEKKKLAYTYPKEGCFGFIDSYVIPKSAPNPDLAHKMANHMLTVPAQLDLTKNNYAVSTQEAMDALTGPAATMYPYKDMASFEKQCKFFPMAPSESDGKVASWPEWLAAWQEVLAA
ncbi:ABC transporter substrate-binding protein [Taklimakanibacter deserti]|uniref:ABC transporter substrate-binding protein n=1 Tax=Taklimakanibacter deserti TaxID=2267839 RepID=UPI000E654CCF